jgi:hypothetical protein
MSNDLLACAHRKPYPMILDHERIPDMPHDFESREWAENRQAFSDEFARLFARIMKGFDRFHALTFDAPWKIERTDRECTDL